MSALLPPKKDVALALLERASVFVHLDPRAEGVIVPPWLKKQPQLVLQIGLNMAVKIPDLEVGEEAVSCTLSFSRSPHFCYVPWGAVYALVGEDGRGMVWPEDIPPEVASQNPAANQRRRQTLRPVANPDPAPEAESVPPPAMDPSEQLEGQLSPEGRKSVPPRRDSIRPDGSRPSVAPQPLRSQPPPRSQQPGPGSQLSGSQLSGSQLSGSHRPSAPPPATSERPAASRRSPSERPYLRLVK